MKTRGIPGLILAVTLCLSPLAPPARATAVATPASSSPATTVRGAVATTITTQPLSTTVSGRQAASFTMTASRVYGQPDFTSDTPNEGGAGSLATPLGVALDGSGNLYVADTDNNRVLYYPSSCSSTEFACPAARVYGQPSFTSSTANNGGVSAGSLNGPVGLAFDGSGNLYVADLLNNRVLMFPSSGGSTQPLTSTGTPRATATGTPVALATGTPSASTTGTPIPTTAPTAVPHLGSLTIRLRSNGLAGSQRARTVIEVVDRRGKLVPTATLTFTNALPAEAHMGRQTLHLLLTATGSGAVVVTASAAGYLPAALTLRPAPGSGSASKAAQSAATGTPAGG